MPVFSTPLSRINLLPLFVFEKKINKNSVLYFKGLHINIVIFIRALVNDQLKGFLMGLILLVNVFYREWQGRVQIYHKYLNDHGKSVIKKEKRKKN